MKKTILGMFAAILLSGTSLSVQAQEYETKHEIGISYGALSNSQYLDVLEDMLAAPFSGKTDLKNEKFFGPLSVEYFYHVSKVVGVGGIFVYGQKTGDLYVDGQVKGENTNHYLTLMPAMKLDWLRKQNFGMYSKLAVGAAYRMEKNDAIDYKETGMHMNWQVSLLGLEAGSPTVRGFVELGMGEQGVLLAGLRYKFN